MTRAETAARLLERRIARKAFTLERRFWANVEKTDGCWEWKLAKRHFGYGAIQVKGKALLTHRVAWELTHGPIPEGMWVLHRCDNPPCVRPDHLALGTPQENSRDRIARGRANWSHGEKNPASKLTRWEVEEIRRMKGLVPQQKIAEMFGVTRATIGHIFKGDTWAL